MKVYKFGGASVKDAESIKNVAQVLRDMKFTQGIVILSAMGKTTNALEEVVHMYMKNESTDTSISSLQAYHKDIMAALFEGGDEVFIRVQQLWDRLKDFLRYNKSEEYNFVYDQVVSFGELISTTIVSNYLRTQGMDNTWLDSRKYIKTDTSYREGIVNWEKSQSLIQALGTDELYVTQGFIASDDNNFNVTLGREGSDYSAAIFAYALDAEEMSIWKDVEGVLNADPRYFKDAILLEEISYREAVEMAFYGASVIHPKTLKPLENKQIPFFVRSFVNPQQGGTKISKSSQMIPQVPCFIYKDQQCLLRISPKDFSFVSEYHMSEIFDRLSQYKIKISLIQISALSLNLCLEDKFGKIPHFEKEIQANFNIEKHEKASLYTIRHFDADSRLKIVMDRDILLEQIVKENLQIVLAQ